MHAAADNAARSSTAISAVGAGATPFIAIVR
jgi:hypothetical protein